MTHCLVRNTTRFQNDRYGIPTPMFIEPIEAQEIDLVFTPLISFDKLGNRIGYGGGYYDRFLAECNPYVHIIGLAITPPLDLIPFEEPHDKRLMSCINHQAVYHF